LKNATLETVTDFGDLQIFEGVTTYPAILTMQSAIAMKDHSFKFWKLQSIQESNFKKEFEDAAQEFPQNKLSESSWELEADNLRTLRDKIVGGKQMLKEVYGSPVYGIKTGLNKAFIVDEVTRNELIRVDKKSDQILKPLLMGINIDRWGENFDPLWIIYTPKNLVKIEDYPAIESHLSQFKDGLEKRATAQAWYELQQAQLVDSHKMLLPKIVYNRFLSKPKFFLDESGRFINDAPYFIPTGDYFTLALLNSNLFWFSVASKATALSGGFFQLHGQYVEQFCFPNFDEARKALLSQRAESCQQLFSKRWEECNAFTRRIPDLCLPERDAKLSTKLQEWWKLADFAAFRAEVKKVFKSEIPLKERSDWEDLFVSGKTEIEKLSAEIRRNEDEINAIVYKLFDLTPDEVALLEESIGAK
jgi:TaqI-like C-terminal specificity domain